MKFFRKKNHVSPVNFPRCFVNNLQAVRQNLLGNLNIDPLQLPLMMPTNSGTAQAVDQHPLRGLDIDILQQPVMSFIRLRPIRNFRHLVRAVLHLHCAGMQMALFKMVTADSCCMTRPKHICSGMPNLGRTTEGLILR